MSFGINKTYDDWRARMAAKEVRFQKERDSLTSGAGLIKILVLGLLGAGLMGAGVYGFKAMPTTGVEIASALSIMVGGVMFWVIRKPFKDLEERREEARRYSDPEYLSKVAAHLRSVGSIAELKDLAYRDDEGHETLHTSAVSHWAENGIIDKSLAQDIDNLLKRYIQGEAYSEAEFKNIQAWLQEVSSPDIYEGPDQSTPKANFLKPLVQSQIQITLSNIFKGIFCTKEGLSGLLFMAGVASTFYHVSIGHTLGPIFDLSLTGMGLGGVLFIGLVIYRRYENAKFAKERQKQIEKTHDFDVMMSGIEDVENFSMEDHRLIFENEMDESFREDLWAKKDRIINRGVQNAVDENCKNLGDRGEFLRAIAEYQGWHEEIMPIYERARAEALKDHPLLNKMAEAPALLERELEGRIDGLAPVKGTSSFEFDSRKAIYKKEFTTSQYRIFAKMEFDVNRDKAKVEWRAEPKNSPQMR